MKKKINVIKPTRRHKKRYVQIKVSFDISGNSEKELYFMFNSAFSYLHGVVKATLANLTLLDVDFQKKCLFFRVNKDCLDDFLGSLLFVKDLGLVCVVDVKNTIKKTNLKEKEKKQI